MLCDYVIMMKEQVAQMNILHLKYASEIAKTGSLNKAAENLYMGQPNLSRAIKELEANLGITIFERSAKGMTVTPDGEKFIGYANKILAQIDEVEAIYKNGTAVSQNFSISVPRASYIAEAFVSFSKKIKQDEPFDLVYKETNSQRAVKNILEADYNLGIIRYAENYDSHFKQLFAQKGLVGELVAEFNYVLIMSKEHPLAKKEEIRFKDLSAYTEIAHADPFVPSVPLATVRKEELPDDIDKRIFVFERGSQFELLSENTNTFMWVSDLPQKTLDRFGLVQRRCPDNTRLYKDILIHRKDYKLTKLDNLFITELTESKRKNIK